MAVSVIYRPEASQKINTSPTASGVQILSGNDPSIGLGNNNAVVFNVGHGISSGQLIYIKGSNSYYNGFWFASVQTANAFYLLRYLGATALEYFGIDVTTDYYTSSLGITDYTKWSCVHLPIIFELKNTLWPTNSVDSVRTISNVTNSNGYCNLTASGDIKATGSAAKLEYVKVTGAGDYSGVYQIISYSSDTSFVIDFDYSTAADTALTNASIQYYYNNYVTKVQVWGGLNIEHEFYAVEPYELLATLDLIPDENNICKFSISDILKQNIAVKNNLLLGTLPNNLDAFTKFFIKYGEEYDDSDGTTLSRSTVSYTDDYSNFQGYAVNAKLPFKNVYSGALSEYIGDDRKFLTAFARPTIFEDQYFDLSLLSDYTGDLIQSVKAYYKNSVLLSTVTTDHTNFDDGVYRISGISDGCSDYDEVRVYVQATETFSNPSFDSGLTDWEQTAAFPQGPWSAGSYLGDNAAAFTFVVFSGTSTNSEYVEHEFFQINPTARTVTYNLRSGAQNSLGGTWGTATLRCRLYKEGTPLADDVVVSGIGPNTTYSGTFVTSESDFDKIGFYVSVTYSGTTFVNMTWEFYMLTFSPNILSEQLTETKTIDIDCACLPANAEGYNIGWLNPYGGFDWWYFKAYNDHLTDIRNSGTAKKNLFPEWPNSTGEFADTVEYQTFRESREQIRLKSQNLTLDQLNALKFIKTSPLVQIVNSIYDRRTILIDTDSFKVYTEGQVTSGTQYTIEFTGTFTNEIESQSV